MLVDKSQQVFRGKIEKAEQSASKLKQLADELEANLDVIRAKMSDHESQVINRVAYDTCRDAIDAEMGKMREVLILDVAYWHRVKHETEQRQAELKKLVHEQMLTLRHKLELEFKLARDMQDDEEEKQDEQSRAASATYEIVRKNPHAPSLITIKLPRNDASAELSEADDCGDYEQFDADLSNNQNCRKTCANRRMSPHP